MTTIAVNLKSMAGDSKVAGSGSIYHCDKVFRIGDSLVGVAGNVQNTTKFLAWFRKECPPDEVAMDLSDDKTFEAVVVNADGIFYYADCVEPDKLHEKFFAIGSGAMAAMAAMLVGKSPAEAVKIAAKLDHNTGGPIKVLELHSGPKRRKMKRSVVKVTTDQQQPTGAPSGEANPATA